MQVDFSSQVGGAPPSRKASSLRNTSGEKGKGVESEDDDDDVGGDEEEISVSQRLFNQGMLSGNNLEV